MPEIRISEAIYKRVLEFKQVIEAVIEDNLDIDTCTEVILGQGLDSMLSELIGSLDHSTLVASFHQMASRNPAEVYSYVVDTLKRGAAVQTQGAMKQKIIGFVSPNNSEDSSD
jgi:hypothetical protein